ncbi:ADPS, partial [Symbiodinium sp. KB8]
MAVTVPPCHSFEANGSRVKWDGWGYQDTQFFINKQGDVELSGKRYDGVFEDGRVLPKFRDYAEAKIGLKIECPPLHLLPEPVLHEPFWADVKAALPGATHLELTAHTQSQGQAAPGSSSGVAVDTPSHEQVTDADLQALEAYEARGGTVAELRGGGPTPPQGGATAEAGALEGTTDPAVRLFHGHGHTVQEMFAIRTGRVGRMPDAVVFPTSHEQVVALVQAAHAHARFVTLMPFGGGTSVSGALECPEDETRSIIVVSTRRMNKVLWVDRESMQACVQAGILGIELESQLKEQGLTMGHEPDSY